MVMQWPFVAPPEGRTVAAKVIPSMSVIIAAYNVAEVVRDAIESALRQTYPPLQIVVCDDGSTDGTDSVLRQFGDAIEVITQPNRGEAAAKNAAALRATGDFIVILDADDSFEPRRLEALAAASSARPDLDVLTTDAWLELDRRRVRRCYHEGFRFEVSDQRVGILRRNFVFGLAAVRRTRFEEIGGLDESITRTCDWDLWIRLIHTGSQVGLVNEPLASYRVRRESLSADRAGMARGGLVTLEKAAGLPLSPAERRALADGMRRQRSRAVEWEARDALLHARPDARRRLLTLGATAGVHPRTRAKAVLAAAAPRLAARRMPAQSWTGAGGVRSS